MRWVRVKTLATKDGRTIRTAHQALLDAKKAGVPAPSSSSSSCPPSGPSTGSPPTPAPCTATTGPSFAEIKMLTRFLWRIALRRAKRAGFKVTVIGFSGDPKTLPHYIDHYRRP
jgi:hypothetical protein